MNPNPTEIPVVEAIRMVHQAMLFPMLLPWPHVCDVLWLSRGGAWWTRRPGLNFARLVWRN